MNTVCYWPAGGNWKVEDLTKGDAERALRHFRNQVERGERTLSDVENLIARLEAWIAFDHNTYMAHDCDQCGQANRIVNECGCDPNNLPTTVTTPKIGDVWKSNVVNHEFVVDGGEETWPGLQGWSKERFTGHRAKRKGDGRLCLAALTEKPDGYPYDFVLIEEEDWR